MWVFFFFFFFCFVLFHSLLLLLSRFNNVWLCVTPETAAHQAPLFLGFSRQEHWSGLPFPSPMHESEKWKWSRSVMSDSSWPHELQPTRLLRPWGFPGKSIGVGCHCLLQFHSLAVVIFRYHIQVVSYSICLSLSDVFISLYVLQDHLCCCKCQKRNCFHGWSIFL